MLAQAHAVSLIEHSVQTDCSFWLISRCSLWGLNSPRFTRWQAVDHRPGGRRSM